MVYFFSYCGTVGIVSQEWMAVLCSSILGKQSGETPDLDPDLISLLLVVLDMVCGG